MPPWISAHPTAAWRGSMQQHSVTPRIGTIIESKIETPGSLEASSVMTAQGARHVFHEFLPSPRRPYCHRGYLWSNPSTSKASSSSSQVFDIYHQALPVFTFRKESRAQPASATSSAWRYTLLMAYQSTFLIHYRNGVNPPLADCARCGYAAASFHPIAAPQTHCIWDESTIA
jgi:hypothetical protein